jgi:hypothetical protein
MHNLLIYDGELCKTMKIGKLASMAAHKYFDEE